MTGLERVPVRGPAGMASCCSAARGNFHVRYPGDGRHVEADLTKQVLAEIEPGGRVRTIYTMSSGKPSTPTVLGRFQRVLEDPRVQLRGHVRIQLLHPRLRDPRLRRSADLCRQPRLPARADPGRAGDLRWVQIGTAVDVYNESGGGSHNVSGHAGP